MPFLHFEEKKNIFQKKHVCNCHMLLLNPQRMVWVWFCHRSAESKLENFQPRLINQTGQRGHISTFSVFPMHIIWFNLRSPTFTVHTRRVLQKYQQSMLLKMSLFIKDTTCFSRLSSPVNTWIQMERFMVYKSYIVYSYGLWW
jgi:hypothetical protein